MKQLMGSDIDYFIFTFRDYIRAQYNLELEVREITMPRGGSTSIGLFIDGNSPHLADIEREKTAFLKHPFDAKYQASSWQSGKVDTTVSWQKMLLGNQPDDNKQWLYKQKLTLFITALCVAIFAFMWLGFAEQVGEWLHYPALDEENFDLWRYISHTLVHLSLLHILFNLTYWWVFGGAIERECGSAKLLQIYLVTGICSAFAQNFVSGPWFFGLSGVVYGVLGYVFIVDKFSDQIYFDLPSGFLSMIIVGIALGFAGPLVDIQIGNTAHIFGLVTGCILGWLDTKFTRKR